MTLPRFSIDHAGDRKLVAEAAAFIALTVGALYLKATFAEYRDGLFLWLGSVLAANAVRNRAKNTPQTPTPEGQK